MGKTLQYAAAKWNRKTQASAAKWAKDVQGAPYCANFEKFVGHPTPDACSNWQTGIQAAVSANAFANGVAGKEQAYIRGMESVA